MSIHLCPANSGIQNPIFKAQGIPDKQPGPIGDLPVYTYPAEKLATYDILLTCLPGLANSQITAIPSHSSPHSATIFAKIKNLPGLRFSRPNGYFEFSDLSDVHRDTIVRSGMVLEPSRPNTYTGCPSYDLFADVFQLSPFSSRIPPGYVNADAIVAYQFMTKGMAIFATLSHTMSGGTAGYLFTTPSQVVVDQGSVNVRPGAVDGSLAVGLDAEGWSLVSDTKLTPVTTPTDGTRTFHRGYRTAAAFEARSTTLGGRFFPYFDGSVLPDKHFAPQVFQDVFFNCLFEDLAKAPQLMNRIRKGYANLANKESGMALSHAYMGIKLAKQGHAQLTFIITQGIYQGFVLEGDFTTSMYGAAYEVRTPTDLESDIRSINKHDNALARIAALFELAKDDAGETVYPTTVQDVSSSRKFLRKYKALDLTKFATYGDFPKNLRKAVADLTYAEQYEPITVSTIQNFLRYSSTMNEGLMDNKPAWIYGDYFERCKDSVIATGLGVFGNVAPSINYGGPKDIVFQLPASIGAQDPNLIPKADGKKPLQYLPIKKVEVDRALGQWNSLFQNGKIHLPAGRKGKEEFTDSRVVYTRIGGEPAFSDTYRLIKEKFYSSKQARGEKRTREEEDQRRNAGSSKKTRREQDVIDSGAF